MPDTIKIIGYDARKAAAERYGIPAQVKHAGRWCRLVSVTGCEATYFAPQKEMRTAWRSHKPVFTTLPVPCTRAKGRV